MSFLAEEEGSPLGLARKFGTRTGAALATDLGRLEYSAVLFTLRISYPLIVFDS